MKKKTSMNVRLLTPRHRDKFAPVDTKASTNPWISSRLNVTLVCINVHETRELWNQNIVFDDCLEYWTVSQSLKHAQSRVASMIARDRKTLSKARKIELWFYHLCSWRCIWVPVCYIVCRRILSKEEKLIKSVNKNQSAAHLFACRKTANSCKLRETFSFDSPTGTSPECKFAESKRDRILLQICICAETRTNFSCSPVTWLPSARE